MGKNTGEISVEKEKNTKFVLGDFIQFAKEEYGCDITAKKCKYGNLFKDAFGVSFLEMRNVERK